MSVSACAVLSGEPLLGREKSCPGIRERPDQVSPRQAGKGGALGAGGGGVRKGRREGLRQKGRKKMVEQRERRGRGD